MSLCILSGMAVPVCAEESRVYQSGSYKYRIKEDGTAKITEYVGNAEAIIIPERLGNYTVTSIGTQAFGFTNCTKKLKIVTIPGCITEIGEYAFGKCQKLEKAEMLYGVKSIGIEAFNFCGRLAEVIIPESVTDIGRDAFFSCNALKSIVIPDSVTELGDSAFQQCENLISVKLSAGLTRISDSTFSSCKNLTSVTGFENVTHIGRQAFYNCNILKNVFLPAGITSIDYNAFYGCDNLADVYFCGTERAWKNILIEAGNEYLTQANIHFHKWNDWVITKNATCAAEGVMTSICSICGAKQTEQIPKTDHTNKTTTAKAAIGKNGSVITKCSVCGAVKSKSTIYAPKTFALSATAYTYNGKVKKPGVTVKDSKGKMLKNGTDYTISYANGRKNVDKYAVKITFKGKYSGIKTLYFTIKPKATSLSALTAKSKGFTVKWKKLTVQTTGYQLQYSTSPDFKGAKTVTVSKNSTTSKAISKLKAKKKYYVRIRTYKTVKINGKNTKIYSSWSTAKSVTTKK